MRTVRGVLRVSGITILSRNTILDYSLYYVFIQLVKYVPSADWTNVGHVTFAILCNARRKCNDRSIFECRDRSLQRASHRARTKVLLKRRIRNRIRARLLNYVHLSTRHAGRYTGVRPI